MWLLCILKPGLVLVWIWGHKALDRDQDWFKTLSWRPFLSSLSSPCAVKVFVSPHSYGRLEEVLKYPRIDLENGLVKASTRIIEWQLTSRPCLAHRCSGWSDIFPHLLWSRGRLVPFQDILCTFAEPFVTREPLTKATYLCQILLRTTHYVRLHYGSPQWLCIPQRSRIHKAYLEGLWWLPWHFGHPHPDKQQQWLPCSIYISYSSLLREDI